jgi:integrase
MARFRLPYVDSFVDRLGIRRYYFRRRYGPRIALPGRPGTPVFMHAYNSALGEDPKSPRTEAPVGTFDALAIAYFGSTKFAKLESSTRTTYRRVIENLIATEGLGHRLVKQMRREHVEFIIARRAATPGAANDVLKKLKILIGHAVDLGWRRDNPALGVSMFKEGEGHHTWSDDEIAQYQARWPIGSKERTAFQLLLDTAQRLSDVSRMTWRDLTDGGINVVQGKTRAKLWIPLHPDLAAALDAWPRAHVAIIVTEVGQPHTAKGFSNWMADRIATAGLPDRCVVHGLRKAAARRLAEAGCSESMIMAITGHTTSKEVARYTRDASQRRMAQDAIDLVARKTNIVSQTFAGNVPNSKKE